MCTFTLDADSLQFRSVTALAQIHRTCIFARIPDASIQHGTGPEGREAGAETNKQKKASGSLKEKTQF